MKSKEVTLAFDVRLHYENEDGLEHLKQSLRQFAWIEMGGCGEKEGSYGMASITGSERVFSKRKYARKSNRRIKTNSHRTIAG